MGELQHIEYEMEWMDHLDALYGSFPQRNDPDAWFYFLHRPEFAEKDKALEIGREILQRMLRHRHISRKVVQLLEDTFHYTTEEIFFLTIPEINAIDFYRQELLGKEEFPPYRLFGTLKDKKDYDGFLAAFEELYAAEPAQEQYSEGLKKLYRMKVKHPYTAILKSRLAASRQEYAKALEALHSLENSYYKFFSAGDIFMDMGMYLEAEEQFEAAGQYPQAYDRELIEGLFYAKYHSGKRQEAMEFAQKVADMGYEPFVLPLKMQILQETCESLLNDRAVEELPEENARTICEYWMMTERYEDVISLCKKYRSQGSESGFWTVNLTEAYLATGHQDFAEGLINACYEGKIALNEEEFDRIREMRARLIFQKGQAADAYEIMENLCRKYPGKLRFQLTYAAMCLTTGRLQKAMRIYSYLRFQAPENPMFPYELGRCLAQQDRPHQAHELFAMAYENDPGFYQALYEMAQSSIEDGQMEQAQQEIDLLYGKIEGRYRGYLKAQIAEMKEDYRGAKGLYRNLIEEEMKEGFPADPAFLYQVYERYFLMKEACGAVAVSMIRSLQRVLKTAPGCAQLWMMLGEIHEEAEVEPEKAIQCYEKAHKAAPYNADVLAKLIEHEMKKHNWQTALIYCERMIACTQAPEAYLMQAECAMELGMEDAFAGDIAAFVTMGGDERETYALCGACAIKMGDYDKAMEIYAKQIEDHDPEEPPCYGEMASCLCKQGRMEEAESILKSAAAEGFHDAKWLDRLYEIQVAMGRFKEAANTLKQIRKERKISIFNDAYGVLSAKLEMEKGKISSARHMAESLSSHEGEKLCAILYVLSGRYRGAAKTLQKLIDREPEELEYYSWMVLCQALWGKRSGAADYAKQGLKVFAEKHVSVEKLSRPDHLCQYAFLLYFTGASQQAYEIFERAASAVPCHDQICQRCCEAYYGIGLCKAFDGDRQEAEAAFRRSLAIRSHNIVCRKLSENLLKSL